MADEGSNVSTQKEIYKNVKGSEKIESDRIIGSEHYNYLRESKTQQIYYYKLQNEKLDYTRDGTYEFADASMIVSGKSFDIKKSKNEGNEGSDFSNFGIVDLEASNNKIFPDEQPKKYLKGYDKGFEGDGKGQVILSEALLIYNGIKVEDVYGKKISFEYFVGYSNFNYEVQEDNDNNPNNAPSNDNRNDRNYLFKDFEVVGIIDKENIGLSNNLTGCTMIFTTASMFYEGNKTFSPTMTVHSEYSEDNIREYFVATYEFSDERQNELFNSGYIRLGSKFFTPIILYKSDNVLKSVLSKTALIYAESYSKLNDFIADFTIHMGDYITESYTAARFSGEIASSAFNSFKLVYQLFSYASLFMLSVGGIIFFSAMVNLFNTIMHSVDSRRNYLGVMRAIGAKSKEIPRLYFYETLSIFTRAMIWITIFGVAICVGLKLGIDKLFSSIDSDAVGIIISIGWEYIAYTFISIISVLIIFGLMFSYGCSRKISKAPIMTVLGD